eukprot:8481988-Ditylum_brightwellii.AAC.1
MNVDKAHCLLGHPDEDKMHASAKHLGWIITRGEMAPCELSAVGKAWQKNVPKASDYVKADKPGMRISWISPL